MDALLHEWKSDLLRIWIPMVVAASMLIGLFGGMEIQGCRDAPAVTPSTTAACQRFCLWLFKLRQRFPDRRSGKGKAQ
jgi:hypothetical protein